jgi:hypothetical protein
MPRPSHLTLALQSKFILLVVTVMKYGTLLWGDSSKSKKIFVLKKENRIKVD